MRNDPLLFIGVVFGTVMWIIVTNVCPAPAADLPIPKKQQQKAPVPKPRPPVQSDRPAGMP
jgi:hypothetical protein